MESTYLCINFVPLSLWCSTVYTCCYKTPDYNDVSDQNYIRLEGLMKFTCVATDHKKILLTDLHIFVTIMDWRIYLHVNIN